MNDNIETLLSLLVAGQVMQLAASIQSQSMAPSGPKSWSQCEAEAISRLSSLAGKVKKTLPHPAS